MKEQEQRGVLNRHQLFGLKRGRKSGGAMILSIIGTITNLLLIIIKRGEILGSLYQNRKPGAFFSRMVVSLHSQPNKTHVSLIGAISKFFDFVINKDLLIISTKAISSAMSSMDVIPLAALLSLNTESVKCLLVASSPECSLNIS